MTSGWDWMNSLIFPLSIHSDTITNCLLSIVTPRSGNTFGWLRAFHLIASLQNLCMDYGQLAGTHVQSNPLFEFCSSRSSSIPSGPWLRLVGLGKRPSTRPRTPHCIAELLVGRNKEGFEEISEAKPDDRRHGTKHSTISSRDVAGDWEESKPN